MQPYGYVNSNENFIAANIGYFYYSLKVQLFGQLFRSAINMFNLNAKSAKQNWKY
jgi:hypothetical protein